MQQAFDFLEESKSLYDLVGTMDKAALSTRTQFMKWSIEDVIGHLHIFNFAAQLAIEDRSKAESFFKPIARDLNSGKSLLDVQYDWLGDLNGPDLVAEWKSGFEATSDAYKGADPAERLAWAGPDMSARSMITARQMETWAHGQAVFDILGQDRIDADRIKNIAYLGINTYGWTFVNRKWDVPEPVPYVRLTAPSGEIWEWHEPQADNMIEGSAVGFCQIVTQTRNPGDTDIKTVGRNAERWMSNAQCFAGPPVSGPDKGQRHKVTN